MRKILLLAAAVLTVSLAGCIWVDDDDVVRGYDFNGLWSFALTGCQAQSANVEIYQTGANFEMTSGPYRFFGGCDPIAATFGARAEGGWGYWDFSGAATGDNTMDGTYAYVEYGVVQCTGRFAGNRISYRGADAPAGPGLERQP